MGKQIQTPKNMTLLEAKREVYNLIQKGASYREIEKIKFLVNGQVKIFNLSQISKISHEFEPPTSSQKLDPDKAEVFRLFRKGYSPVQVVIQTQFQSEYVKKAYQEYLEFEEKTLVPDWFVNGILKLVQHLDKNCNGYKDMALRVKEAVESHLKLKKFIIKCKTCGKPITLDGEALSIFGDLLTRKGYEHDKCIS